MDILDKHINDLTKEDWIEVYEKRGMSLPKLAENFGVCTRTIYSRMENFDISRRGFGRQPEVKIEKNVLVNLYYEDNLSLAAIGEKLGISDKTVKRLFRDYAIKLKPKANSILTKEFLNQRFVKEEKTATDIAKEAGVSTPTVCKYLRKFGFDLRTGVRYSGSSDIENKIADMYLSGMKSTDIAIELNKSTQFVFNSLARKGIDSRKCNSYKSKLPRKEKVCSLYFDDMMSIGQIAGKYGTAKSTVSKAIKSTGAKLRNRSDGKLAALNNMYGKKHTKKTREKMSDAYSKEVRDINDYFGRGIPEVVSTSMQGEVTVRSSWEAGVCRYFNSLGVKYLYEPVVFDLVVDRVKTTYKPDFLVLPGPECKKEFYLEVKGLWNDEAKKKVDKAVEAGHNVVVWEGEDLQKKGILDNSFRPLY